MDSAELVEPPRNEARSIGVVKTQYATLFESPHELQLVCGARLGPVRVAYETYGELSAACDNAIFVCHALTGDAHVAGLHTVDSRKPGWWDELVGPGKGLDTNRYFIICANIIGGCQGSTGPNSTDPATGTPYGLRMCPFLTVGDFVQVHSALVKHLGIKKLLAIVGGSLGGMQVLEWVSRYPEQMGAAVCLASAARLTAQGIAFNCVGRRAIVTDPNFHNGDYYDKPQGPNHGLAIARMVAHITYLSEASIEKKFGRRLQHAERFAYELLHDTEFQIESYLKHQGSRFVERFDANSYLYLTRAMDYFDLADSYGSLEKAFSRTQARFLITSYTTDWLFPTIQSRELVDALVAARRHVSFVELSSPYGHDSFLLEVEPLEELLRPFLEQTYLACQRESTP
ncbi:MAG: homoserine O-acetyltransferase [Planctomycetes bacterium]|nr:homoserine O-acetyltransferase [Planctomycetota bacterium]